MVAIRDKDRGWNKITRNIVASNNWVTGVGFPGSAGISSAIVTRAAVHEYGSVSKKIPSRPFMRQAISLYKQQIQQRMDAEARGIIEGRHTARTAAARIGEFFTGAIKATFTRGTFRALKPRTILAKGSSRPLIDTGEMRNSVTHAEFRKR